MSGGSGRKVADAVLGMFGKGRRGCKGGKLNGTRGEVVVEGRLSDRTIKTIHVVRRIRVRQCGIADWTVIEEPRIIE